MAASHNYANSKKEEWARWSRRDHANIEDLQNLVFAAVAEETGVSIPPNVRQFISALQGVHGGGEVINEPFQRSHATLASRLHFTGTQEAVEARVRRRIDQLEEYQAECRYKFFHVERGGQVVGRDPVTKKEIYSATTYTDLVKSPVYDGMVRARGSEGWKKHPGRALAAQVGWVLSQLVRVDPPEESAPSPDSKPAKVLSLADYKAAREPRLLAAVEKYVDGCAERGGDPLAELERLEVLVSRLRASRAKTRQKEDVQARRVGAEEEARRKDAPAWEGYGPEATTPTATAYTANKSEPDGVPLCDFLAGLVGQPPLTKMSPPPSDKGKGDSGLASEEGAEVDESSPDMGAWALWWAGGGIAVFPMHDVFDGICSCPCRMTAPKGKRPKCRPDRHRCGADCPSPGKHSRVAEWEKVATTDPEQIRAWWGRWPHANIGGLMGGPRRVLALDFDPKGGGDASLHDLIEAHGGDWMDTFNNQTGSLGDHFLFTYPEGVTLRNSAGVVGPGVDTRAEGGCIVLPPSTHYTGRRYAIKNLTKIKPAPDWLLSVFADAADVPEPKVVNFQEAKGRQTFSASRGAGEKFYEPGRNSGLFGVGMGRLRHGWFASESELLAQLLEVNEWRCVPPLESDEVEDMAAHIWSDYGYLLGVDSSGKGAA